MSRNFFWHAINAWFCKIRLDRPKFKTKQAEMGMIGQEENGCTCNEN